MKFNKILILFVPLLLLPVFSVYSKTPEEAKSELTQMNIEYSQNSFFKRIKKGDINAVNLFLASGIDPNVADDYGRTPLITAAQYNRVEITKALLNKKVNINAIDSTGFNALLAGVLRGHSEIVQLVAENGADVNAVIERIGPNKAAPEGITALMLAVAEGHIEVAKTLIKYGANLNAKAQNNSTALFLAAQNGRVELVDILIADGADVNARNESGETILIRALSYSRKTVARSLIEKGVNLNLSAKDRYGNTALKLAKEKGYDEIVQLLKQAGAKE